MILLLLSILWTTSSHRITLCEYFEQLGISRPECSQHTSFTSISNIYRDSNVDEITILPSMVCANGLSSGSCCTSPALSRCSTDYDCHGKSTMPSICCPTGCNYNMCVHMGIKTSSFNQNLGRRRVNETAGRITWNQQVELQLK
uniref:WAP domain-containing protein n=1 Tax=Heterorhabditis bacteriophora TaxID=37862 RepID=A0A1I7XMZ3_HETBA